MNHKRNLLPEYVWMIFVGMLLAIIILMHITPGLAAESDFVTPIPTSSIDPTDSCLCVDVCGNDVALFTQNSADFYALRSAYQSHEITKEEFLSQAYFVRYASAGPFDDFYRDVKIALTQLMAQFPGFHVAMFDDYAATYPYIPLKEAIEEVGCPVREDYYPYSYSTNRVLIYVNTPFINAPVWVWDSNVPTPTPSPSPVPPQDQFVDLYVGAPWFTSGSYFTQVGYYWLTFVTNDFELDLPNSTNAFALAYSNYNVFNPWKRSVLFSLSRGTDFLFYLYSDSISDIRIYFTGSAHYSDLNFVKENFSYVSFSVNDSWNFRSGSYSGLTGFQFLSDSGSILSSSLYVHELGTISSWSNDSTDLNFNLNPSTVNNAFVQALRFGLDGAYVPEPTPDPNQPSPSPTQAPLPTSGESIHVILPSGTPTPTPPFTIQPGEGGGNGSPGSFGGNGLSSGETSGILQAFSMYVSDNPVFAFLGGLFSAFPGELMYPLYILLFILIILGIIRVFIHFTGG